MTIIGTAEVALSPDTAGFGGAVMTKLSGIIGAMSTPLGGLALAGIAAGTALFEIGESFEGAYRKIRSNTGATEEQMKGLESSFKTILASGPASMDQVAAALSLVSQRTKLTGADLEGLTETELKLSRITGTDVKQIVDSTTKAFANFGIEGIGPSKLALNELLQVSQNTGISVDQLSNAVVGKAGATFRAMGVDIGSAASILGTLEAQGVTTGPVIMGLSKAVTQAGKDGKDVHQVMTDLFSTLKDGVPGTEAYGDAIKTLGSRGFLTLQEAVKSGKLTMDEFNGTFAADPDRIDRIAKENQTLGGLFKTLKNEVLVALEPIATKFVEFTTVVVRGGVEELRVAFGIAGDAWHAFSEAFNGEGITSDGWVGQIETLGVSAREVFDYLSSAWKQVVAGFSGDGNVVGPFTDLGRVAREVADFLRDHWQPIAIAAGVAIGLLAAPVLTVTAGFIALYTQSKTFRDIIAGVGDVIQKVTAFFVEHRAAQVALAGVLLAMVSPLAAIAAGFIYLYNNSEVFRSALNSLGASVADFARFFAERWDRIREAGENVFTALKIAIEVFLAVAIGPAILIWQNFGEQISAVLQLAWDNVSAILDFATRLLGDFFDFVTAILTGNWGDAWAAFADVPAAMFDLLTAEVENLGSFLIDFFSSLPSNILGLLGDLASLFISAGSSLLGGLLSGIVGAFVGVTEWFVGLPAALLGFMADAASWLVDVGRNVIIGVHNGILAAFLDVTAWFIALPGVLIGFFASAASWLHDNGWDILQGVLSGIRDKELEVAAWFLALPGVLVGFFATAATWLVDVGKAVLAGMWSGVQAGYDAGVHFLTDLPGRIKGALSAAPSWLVDIGTKVITGLWDGIQSMTSWLTTQASNIIQWVRGGLSDAGSALWDLAVNIVVGVWQGIDSMRSWLWDKVTGFFSGMWDAVKSIFKVWSPSRVTMETGGYIVEGFALGIEAQGPRLADAIRATISDPLLAASEAAQAWADGVSRAGTSTSNPGVGIASNATGTHDHQAVPDWEKWIADMTTVGSRDPATTLNPGRDTGWGETPGRLWGSPGRYASGHGPTAVGPLTPVHLTVELNLGGLESVPAGLAEQLAASVQDIGDIVGGHLAVAVKA